MVGISVRECNCAVVKLHSMLYTCRYTTFLTTCIVVSEWGYTAVRSARFAKQISLNYVLYYINRSSGAQSHGCVRVFTAVQTQLKYYFLYKSQLICSGASHLVRLMSCTTHYNCARTAIVAVQTPSNSM